MKMIVDLKNKKAIVIRKKINKNNRKGVTNMINTKTIKTVKCQYCGKELKDNRIQIKIGEVMSYISIGYEKCDCKNAQRDYKQQKIKMEKIKRLKAEKEKQERIKQLYTKSGMPTRLKGYTFSNFKVNSTNQKQWLKAQEYAQKCLSGKTQGSLFIAGKVGAGKTHLASSIANAFILDEKPVIFGTLINLLGEIKDSYKDDSETEGNIIRRYSSIPLLVIDDLGKEKPSEWTLEKLFTIINNRYENNLPVVITTNYNRDQLTERLSNGSNDVIAESIISRLYAMCSGIYLGGKDKRKELV